MSGARHRQRRRPGPPPAETIFSSVLGAYLGPIDALLTIFYSILFALLFTLSSGVLIFRGLVSSPQASGLELFFTILGAVTAWGIVDGVLYFLGEGLTRRERHRLLQQVQASDSEEAAAAAIACELDFILEPITSEEQRRGIYRDILACLSQAEPQEIGIHREDVVGAVATVLLSVLVVLPSLLPLLLLPDDTALAIRISNGVSFVVIFGAGYAWGVHTGAKPWKIGLLLASVCVAMVLVAMVLEG